MDTPISPSDELFQTLKWELKRFLSSIKFKSYHVLTLTLQGESIKEAPFSFEVSFNLKPFSKLISGLSAQNPPKIVGLSLSSAIFPPEGWANLSSFQLKNLLLEPAILFKASAELITPERDGEKYLEAEASLNLINILRKGLAILFPRKIELSNLNQISLKLSSSRLQLADLGSETFKASPLVFNKLLSLHLLLDKELPIDLYRSLRENLSPRISLKASPTLSRLAKKLVIDPVPLERVVPPRRLANVIHQSIQAIPSEWEIMIFDPSTSVKDELGTQHLPQDLRERLKFLGSFQEFLDILEESLKRGSGESYSLTFFVPYTTLDKSLDVDLSQSFEPANFRGVDLSIINHLGFQRSSGLLSYSLYPPMYALIYSNLIPIPLVTLLGSSEAFLEILHHVKGRSKSELSPMLAFQLIYRDLVFKNEDFPSLRKIEVVYSPLPSIILDLYSRDLRGLLNLKEKPKVVDERELRSEISVHFRIPSLADIEGDDKSDWGTWIFPKPKLNLSASLIMLYPGSLKALRRTANVIFSFGGDSAGLSEVILLVPDADLSPEEVSYLDSLAKLPSYKIISSTPHKLPYYILANAIEEASKEITVLILDPLSPGTSSWLDKVISFFEHASSLDPKYNLKGFQPLVLHRGFEKILTPNLAISLPRDHFHANRDIHFENLVLIPDMRLVALDTLTLKEIYFDRGFYREANTFVGLGGEISMKMLERGEFIRRIPIYLTSSSPALSVGIRKLIENGTRPEEIPLKRLEDETHFINTLENLILNTERAQLKRILEKHLNEILLNLSVNPIKNSQLILEVR